MSQETELLGKPVYYFDDPRLETGPVLAFIVLLVDGGHVTVMIPRPERDIVEYKTWVKHSYEPKAYCWMDIVDYETSQYWTMDV